jgi:hypothetical protein
MNVHSSWKSAFSQPKLDFFFSALKGQLWPRRWAGKMGYWVCGILLHLLPFEDCANMALPSEKNDSASRVLR